MTYPWVIAILLGYLGFMLVLVEVVHRVGVRVRRRFRAVKAFRHSLAIITKKRIIADVRAGKAWRWRWYDFESVGFLKMFCSFKPLEVANFYESTTFTKPIFEERDNTNRRDTYMYLLMAYVAGSWGFGGLDPHEECAVMFIDQIDKEFGEGTAFVVKLPDKDETSDVQDHADMAGLLSNLENGNLNLDDALAEFNNRHNG